LICLHVLTNEHAYLTSNGQRILCDSRAANLHATIRLSTNLSVVQIAQNRVTECNVIY